MDSRDMKRTLLLATLPIAVLLGGGVALVLVVTSPRAARAPPDPPAPLGPPIEPAPAPIPPPGPAAAPRPTAEQRTGGPTRGSWIARAEDPSSIPMAGRAIRKIVRRGLLAARVQSRLARCADQIGGVGDGPVPRGTPAILRLELEGLEGEVRIVDAAVQQWGGASEATVSCATGALRGQVIGAAPSRRGERSWMPYPLNPRGEALAAFP
jgi:hypothetical protein